MRVHLTRAASFTPFCHFLENRGIDVTRQLSALGIAPDRMAAAEALVPLNSCCRFVERMSRFGGIDDLGLLVGREASVGDFGLFGHVLRHSLTLKDLLENFIQWVPLVDSGAHAWLDREKGSAHLRFMIRHDVDCAEASVDEYALMLLIDAVRIALGPEWRPTAVWLNRPKPDRLSRFEALSEATLFSDRDAAGLRIPRKLLQSPVRQEPAMGEDAAGQIQTLQSTAPPEDLIDSILAAIQSGLGSELPSLDRISEQAGLSQRAIQRRLQSRGTSYRELLDRVRFDEAHRLLENEAIPIQEIASRLGYGELSNFTHAFRRWTGSAPTQVRLQGPS